MSDPDANFLSRWSRLKQRSRAAGPVSDDGTAAPVTGEEPAARVPATAGAAAVPGAAAAANAPAPPGGEQADPAVPVRIDEPLPPVESLTADSDFRPFMRAGIDAATRNAALKRLFADPAFNVMDGLDVYIDDYGKTEPIPSALLRRLVEAQSPVLADAAAEPTHDLAHDLAHDFDARFDARFDPDSWRRRGSGRGGGPARARRRRQQRRRSMRRRWRGRRGR